MPVSHNDSTSNHDEIISELLKNGSIEFADKVDSIAEAKDILPYSTSVYIPSIPRSPLSDVLENLRFLHAAGFDPVPHIAARRINSAAELNNFLEKAVNEYGVHRVLLVGGDIDQPLGPYNDAVQILQEGILSNAGVREVGLGGYPEGHPRITKDILDSALKEKINLANAQGMGVTVVTQFSFNPSRIVDYCGHLSREYPDVSVYIGMAGPTDPLNLMKYAKICGVSASLRALSDMGFKAAKLVSHPDPIEQLEMLARYVAGREMPNILGVHIFSFGGFIASAKWMNEKSIHLSN